MTDPKLGVIVDANNLIFSLYSVGGAQHCLKNFLRQLEQLENLSRTPSWLVCAFDSSESKRKELEPTYKANREEKPDDLVELFQEAKTAVGDAGWIVAEETGFEADDILASCASSLVELGHLVLLVARDKDFFQCLRPGRVTIAQKVTVRGEVEYFTTDDFKKKFELEPSQWIDFQTLTGDSIDNVVGCPGIGTKTAIKLLKASGSLDRLLDSPELASKKIAENLVKFRKRYPVVRELVTLKTDLPVQDYLR